MSSSFGSDDVRLDISSLAATVQTRLNASPQYSRRPCICRVPKLLRQANEQAYTPVQVSIGPLHHNDERLLHMEVHKVKYLQSFLCDPRANTAGLLNSCLRKVKEKETEIRECYAEPINLSSDEFCEMVLIDSAFIIQLFRKGMGSTLIKDDYMYGNPWLGNTVHRDIQLEENQLPFFIIDELYHAAFQTNASISNSITSFTKIACKFLNLKYNSNMEEQSYFHLLHLFVFHRSPASTTNTTNIGSGNDIEDLIFPAATQLYAAGVKFQVINDSSTIFDIKFDHVRGILKMPKLCVDDETEREFRNTVAFEQCNYLNETRYFSDYEYFLDCLINSPEDVQLLTDAKIIQNLMGSPQEVSELINSLGTNVFSSSKGYYYEKISLQLQNHCEERWNRYRATLMHTYFKHPWAAISVGYAIVLLLLTVIQVVAGILAIP